MMDTREIESTLALMLVEMRQICFQLERIADKLPNDTEDK